MISIDIETIVVAKKVFKDPGSRFQQGFWFKSGEF
jgi:hypothetical protein